MMKYTVQWRYKSDLGAFAEGDVVDLDDATAEHINRDSKGVLVPYEEPTAPIPPIAPPHDRMMKAPANVRGKGGKRGTG